MKHHIILFISIVLSTIANCNAAVEYPFGACMNKAYDDSTDTLGCTANEVSATVVGVDGPSTCKLGEFIFVNITTSIEFKATRYDFAIYSAVETGGDPISGNSDGMGCSLDVLGIGKYSTFFGRYSRCAYSTYCPVSYQYQ